MTALLLVLGAVALVAWLARCHPEVLLWLVCLGVVLFASHRAGC